MGKYSIRISNRITTTNGTRITNNLNVMIKSGNVTYRYSRGGEGLRARTVLLQDLIQDNAGRNVRFEGNYRADRIDLTEASDLSRGVEIDTLTIESCTLTMSSDWLAGFKVNEIVFRDVVFENLINNTQNPVSVKSIFIDDCRTKEHNMCFAFGAFEEVESLKIEANYIRTELSLNKKLKYLDLKAEQITIPKGYPLPGSLRYLKLKTPRLLLAPDVFDNLTDKLERLSINLDRKRGFEPDDTMTALDNTSQLNLEYLQLSNIDISYMPELYGSRKLKVLDISRVLIGENQTVHAPEVIIQNCEYTNVEMLAGNDVTLYIDNTFKANLIPADSTNISFKFTTEDNDNIFYNSKIKANGTPLPDDHIVNKVLDIINSNDLHLKAKQLLISHIDDGQYLKHIKLFESKPQCVNVYSNDNRLTSYSVICIPYNLKEDVKAGIENKLNTKNIKIVAELIESVTHVLFTSPEDKYNFPAGMPRDFDIINLNGLDYLMRDKEGLHEAEKLYKLLESPNMAGIAIAMLAKNNYNIDHDLAGRLFAYYKCDKQYSSVAKKVVTKLDFMPPFLQKAIRSRKSFFDHKRRKEEGTYKKFVKLSEDWGVEAAAFLNLEMHKLYGTNLLFPLLELPHHHSLYQKALEYLTDTDGTFTWPERESMDSILFARYIRYPEKIKRIVFGGRFAIELYEMPAFTHVEEVVFDVYPPNDLTCLDTLKSLKTVHFNSVYSWRRSKITPNDIFPEWEDIPSVETIYIEGKEYRREDVV